MIQTEVQMIKNEIKSHHVIRASGNYYSVLQYQIIHLKLIQSQLKQSAFNGMRDY